MASAKRIRCQSPPPSVSSASEDEKEEEKEEKVPGMHGRDVSGYQQDLIELAGMISSTLGGMVADQTNTKMYGKVVGDYMDKWMTAQMNKLDDDLVERLENVKTKEETDKILDSVGIDEDLRDHFLATNDP